MDCTTDNGKVKASCIIEIDKITHKHVQPLADNIEVIKKSLVGDLQNDKEGIIPRLVRVESAVKNQTKIVGIATAGLITLIVKTVYSLFVQ